METGRYKDWFNESLQLKFLITRHWIEVCRQRGLLAYRSPQDSSFEIAAPLNPLKPLKKQNSISYCQISCESENDLPIDNWEDYMEFLRFK
jgi:hypothetical protein